MAEILSLAASGIAVAQVAGQVGALIVKLKRLWEQVQDVPWEIERLLRQTDCLGPLLAESQSCLHRSNSPLPIWDNTTMSRADEYCRQCLNALSDMVNELDSQIKAAKRSRKIIATRIALKRHILVRLEKKLDDAVRLLNFAQYNYLCALLTAQPDAIVQKFIALRQHDTKQHTDIEDNIHTAETVDSDILLATSTRSSSRQNHHPLNRYYDPTSKCRALGPAGTMSLSFNALGFDCTIQLPRWIFWTAWQLQSSKASGYWQCSLRAYTVQPDTAAIFHTAEFGTPLQLRQSFQKRSSSPYDCDSLGRSLLYYAMRGGSIKTISYLYDIGLILSGTEHFSRTQEGGGSGWSLEKSMEFFKAMISERRDLAEEIAEANAQAGNIRTAKGLFEYIPGPVCACTSCYNSLTLLKIAQSYECPRHKSCSLESRIARAFHVACNWGVSDVFVSLLQPEWQANARSVCDTSSAVFPLISMVALRIWDESSRSFDARGYNCLVSWSTLAEDIIRNSPDLHIICPTLKMTCKFEADFTIEALSPLLTVLLSGVQRTYSSLQDFFEDRIGLLSTWLYLCANADVDLLEYGRREMKMLLEDGATRHACSLEVVDREGCVQKVKVCLTGFKYGNTTKDWDILWSEKTVPPFSGLQAASHYSIPGAWVDDECV